MTALTLLAYISAALLLQLLAGIGMAVWRRRRGEAGAMPLPAAPSAHVAWTGWREFRVVRREFEDSSHSQCSFYLAPLDGAMLPPFLPGQFLTFAVNAGAGQGSPLVRCYSLSELPDPVHYRVTVKRALAPPGQPELPPGKVSNHLHDTVQVGDVLKVKAPTGRFVLDPAADMPVVLIAGGIGITPLLCMLRWCLAERPGRSVHLYYGVRTAQELAFGELLAELARTHPAFHLHVVCSNPATDDRNCPHTGYIDVPLLRQTLPAGHHQFYVCGPTPMMESLVPALADWGVPVQDIHFETFGPASIRLGATGATQDQAETNARFEVAFRRSGRTLTWDGQDASLLDFAERHGVSVESGCRAGSCGSCETVLIEGTVGYAHTPDYPVTPGRCLLCVGIPRSPLVLDA
ncbi:2Fe-2S iron-sulfur cluster-binding protein [Rhodanobacter aciditrophus]|uniref:2Fe-2S iron-sulfur cluster-binding protein n=1 Tax=Rhodanobacter aciditrophus TaxID=1623218 RepID=UPI003CF2F285